MSLQQRAPWRSRDLYYCVRDCASDAGFVAAFNRRCGTHLQAPIRQLLDPPPKEILDSTVSEEEVEAALFLEYVLLTVCPRLRALMRGRLWNTMLADAAVRKKRCSARAAETAICSCAGGSQADDMT